MKDQYKTKQAPKKLVDKRTKAQRESEKRFATIFNTQQNGIIIVDPGTHTIDDANAAALHMIGATREDVIGRECHKFICPAKRGKCPITDLGIDVDNSERVLIRIDHTELSILKTVSRLKLGSKNFLIESFIDITERKRMEEVLREQESKLSSIFCAAPVGIGMVINRVFREANDTLCQMTGYSREELLGRNARMLYPTQEDYDYVGQEKYRQIGEKSTGTVETRWKRKDGTVIDIILSSTPLDPDDLAKGVTFTALDITESKRAEEALRESEKRLSSIIQGFSIPAFVIGKDHKVLYWNQALERLSKIPAVEMVGTNQHWRAFYAQERPCMADLLVDEAIDKIPQWYEGKYIKSSLIDGVCEATDFFPALGEKGRLLRFTAAAVRDFHGNLVSAMETLEDVTERKRAEERLRESEEKYRTLVETTRDLIYTADRKGFLTYMNPTLERTLGYTHDEWNGKTFGQIVAPECIDSVRDIFRRAMRGESIPVYEVDLIRKDGTRLSVEFNVSTIYDNEGKPVGRYGIGKRHHRPQAGRGGAAGERGTVSDIGGKCE